MNIHNRGFQRGAARVGILMIANRQYARTLFVQPLQAGTGWSLSVVPVAD
jgi:hypothetical protein